MEQVLPQIRVLTGSKGGQRLRYAYIDVDGQAVSVYQSNGSLVSREVTGAYGVPLSTGANPGAHGGWSVTPTSWTVDGLHGQEEDRANEVMHFGTRHTMFRDGMWLQPEPLLAKGPSVVGYTTASPRHLSSGSYAAANPVGLHDLSGRVPPPAVAAGGAVVAVPPAVVVGVAAVGVGAVGVGAYAADQLFNNGNGAAAVSAGASSVQATVSNTVTAMGDTAAGLVNSVNTGVGSLPAGTLTPDELGQIQDIAGQFDTTIDVVGSRAAGEGRNIDSDAPVGKGEGTRSDIDFRVDGSHPDLEGLCEACGNVGQGAGNASAQHSNNPASEGGRETFPPYIRVEPDGSTSHVTD